MLFVFGFKARKMRQDKVSGLVHNSLAFPNEEWCGVDVHFQDIIDLVGCLLSLFIVKDGEEFQVVPNSELIITRRASKQNKSMYLIDGKNSSYSEVTTLLKARGIDLDHKRFLILQVR